MGKGIKMRSAQDRHGNPYSVETLQAMHDRQQTIPDLICDHPPCGCDLRFVPRYQQNRANRIEPIDVPAYIGLTSDSEHITGCRYDAPGRITAIVAQSDPDFIKALDDGKRELRLLALHNGLGGRSLSGVTSAPGGKAIHLQCGLITQMRKWDAVSSHGTFLKRVPRIASNPYERVVRARCRQIHALLLPGQRRRLSYSRRLFDPLHRSSWLADVLPQRFLLAKPPTWMGCGISPDLLRWVREDLQQALTHTSRQEVRPPSRHSTRIPLHLCV